MKFCKTCKTPINGDQISESIYTIKQQCLPCSGIKLKTISMEEYEEMKAKELGNSRIADNEEHAK